MKDSFRPAFMISLPVALLLAILITSGCDKEVATETGADKESQSTSETVAASTNTSSTVGIVDLEEAAKELGLSNQFTQILNGQGKQLQDQLNNVILAMQSNLDKQRREFGEEPSDEQVRQLQQLEAQGMQTIRNMQAQAQQQAAQLRQSLSEQIQTLLKGPVEKVAKQRGMRLVLVKRVDTVFYAADGVNITSEVISTAREAGVTKLNTEGLSADGSTIPETPAAPDDKEEDDASQATPDKELSKES